MLVPILKKCLKFIINPAYRFSFLSSHGFLNYMSDEAYLKKAFKLNMGKELNLSNPKTFNEKLQWLKLYDRKPIYTTMVDKYAVKQYVASIIGEEYIIPTLGVWERFGDIDFDNLPNQFVLKCTHDSGSIVICRDKNTFDIEAAKKKINKCLKRNFYWAGREWPYKNIKPRIIAEKYLTDESGYELKDYKVFNFNGELKLIQVDFNRFIEHQRNLYDTDWNYVEAQIQFPTNPEHKIKKPQTLSEMLTIARKLSEKIPHVRTDFYSIEDKIYFGEMTFYHGSGFEKFTPEEFATTMGSWIQLPNGGGYFAVIIFIYGYTLFLPIKIKNYKIISSCVLMVRLELHSSVQNASLKAA